MKDKKFFDSYVEYRSPVHGEDAATPPPSAPETAPRRALPRRETATLARYNDDGTLEPAAPAPPVEPKKTPKTDGLRAFIDLLWRRRWLVLPIFLGVLLLGFLLSLRAKKVYQATATLLVNTTPLSGEKRPPAESQEKVASDVPTVDEARRLETQLEIVKTQGVLDGAIARLEPANKTAIDRYHTVDVGSIRNTDLVTVTARSYDPAASAALANAVCASYIEQSQKNNRTQIESAAKSAQDQLRSVKSDLNGARDALKNFQASSGISDGAEQTKNVAATLDLLKTQLRDAQTARASAAASLGVAQDVLSKTPREVVTYNTITRPTVISLRAELTKLRLDRIAARAEYAEGSLVVQALDQQIARVQNQLATEPETETAPAQSAPNPAYITAAQAVAQARTDLQSLQARIPVLSASLQRAARAQAQLPAKTSRLNVLSSNAAALQTTYDDLGQKVQALQLSAASQLANGSVTSPANPPGAPVSPSRTRTLLMAALLGALLAYIVAMIVDRLDEKVHSSSDAGRAANLPILIEVPHIGSPSEQCILTGNPPLLRESFEMLAAQISLAGRKRTVRSVLMTSSLPGEGKSVSCVNLAVAAAWAGEEVVLVDCDLRRPTTHLFFGLNNDVGFSDVILGDATLDQAVQPTKIPGLSVLTAGSHHDSPLELLRSQEAQDVLDELSQRTDLTLIDSPPVLLIADAALLSTMTDTTILVVACGEAAKSEIARAVDTLEQAGAPVLGVVLTKVGAHLGDNTRGAYAAYSSKRELKDLRGPGERGHAAPTREVVPATHEFGRAFDPNADEKTPFDGERRDA